MSDPGSPPGPTRRSGVSPLELFFDLVFVFTITQLTSVLVREPGWRGLLQVSVMLGLIFWMYGGYAWLTNSVAVDRLGRRLTLHGGMAAFLVVALAIPGAFTGSGATFGFGYLAVVSIHLALFARAAQVSVVRAILRLAPLNLATALLVVAGGIAGATVQYVLWGSAVVLEWISPKLIDDSGFVIEPAHFVERHGLVVLVAIGESVVAVGIGAAGLAVSGRLVLVAVLGLALSACLWWSHFGTDEGAPEEAMTRAPAARRPSLAVEAFGYCHLPILLGIIAIAAALKSMTAQPFIAAALSRAVALGAGGAVFLLGEAWFRRTLGIGGSGRRAVAALLALATIPLGSEISAAAQLGALVAVFVGMLVAPSARPPARPTGRVTGAGRRPLARVPGPEPRR